MCVAHTEGRGATPCATAHTPRRAAVPGIRPRAVALPRVEDSRPELAATLDVSDLQI